jgi:hypothetical protein
MTADETFGEADSGTGLDLRSPRPRHHDRYAGMLRYVGATFTGLLAGFLFIGSIQMGVSWALEGPGPNDWDAVRWGDHWVWRAIASLVATAAGGFIAGMIARRRGARVAVACTVPTAGFWALVAWIGWTGHNPVAGTEGYFPLGYRIVATILCLASLPLAGAVGTEGAGYGRANSEHFDARRATLLGVRWYHFLWLPFLIHVMVFTAAFGAVYGSKWVVVALRNGFSLLAIVPTFFYVAMVMTLQLLATGAWRTYEALGGFTDSDPAPVWRQVVKYGFGYTALTVLAQVAVGLVHYGLYLLVGKVLG